jgi:hypothetical protein
MMLVFLVCVAPKEYLHDALYHHHDAVHRNYKKGEIVFTPRHHHCGFLGFAFAPFLATPKSYFVGYEVLVHLEKRLPEHFGYHYVSEHYTYTLRGPPATPTV